MGDINLYKPEFNLERDTFLGTKEVKTKKLFYLSKMAQDEQWNYSGENENKILYNYLCYTYDRLKQEDSIKRNEERYKILVCDNDEYMCFNTGLLTRSNGTDIYAYFGKNTSAYARSGQNWFLIGFYQKTDSEMSKFKYYPEIADYFTNPADFIYDKKLQLYIDYDHIIDDNYERFEKLGLSDKHIIKALLENAVKTITEKVKRNYKLAIPQFYTDKGTMQSKIQLLLPLFLFGREYADLALVVDKSEYRYVGKTILTLEWAYVNSRRIVRPDAEWLKI
ncbi:DUF3825 domain-containing protein [Bariatricus massiliensis]|uniref:DUF3825 domain-containing protein n=1 Tax=Bariatricus massiliensis TaxID=1745713 RepID=A0ABS8DHE6_9FIRM|nr:DUF3825 domain-containing protein [Bariatricus massiliensis]MCB7304842.1 DUF3825 domain-containing protein [Bariatricus massiliensis]MCB7375396.1 DUF3825 domain-containing protein [Bariatricus massiliensis]MCB7387856.1 DUF3825 domain-containing protein [Bariatricus massiliensis]MCB7412055.1 DUF3825 domain-containing protein [Bariatricus massiliensis]MCQ5254565.1 DUF3825 domain-containing protein [Bariatricus massiliensis]